MNFFSLLLNGTGYAKRVDRVSLPRSRLVDTSRDFADRFIQTPAAVTHSHGPGGEHSHGGTAFTTWLDLAQASQQAEAVARAIGRKRRDAKDRIARNLTALRGDLLAFDARIAAIAGSDPGRSLLASHPVYQYLAGGYGLNLRSVLWEPDRVPSQPQWAELERILREHPAIWMIWEGKPVKEKVGRLRALGAMGTEPPIAQRSPHSPARKWGRDPNGPAKDGRSRTVYMPDDLRKVLVEHRRRLPEEAKGGYPEGPMHGFAWSTPGKVPVITSTE